jgi:hypothetical protein
MMQLSTLITVLFISSVLPSQSVIDLSSPVIYCSSISTEQPTTPIPLSDKAPINKLNSNTVPSVKSAKAEKIELAQTHPVIYKVGTPIRICWHGVKKVSSTCSKTAIRIGKKAEPYMPFLSFCGAIGNIATPFSAHFINK